MSTEAASQAGLFEGFKLSMINTGEAVIRARHGGSGPPLLLLHGHPQTHLIWHRLAPLLAKDFTVVAADLRGYGDSSKPPTTPDHARPRTVFETRHGTRPGRADAPAGLRPFCGGWA